MQIFFFIHVHSGLQVNTYNITGLAGSSLLLNCTVDPHVVGQVIWIRPGDNAVVSRDNGVVNANNEQMQNRFMIIGDYTRGQYHLLITYALFPRDAGTWICSSESVTHRVNVVLLVRPNIEVRGIDLILLVLFFRYLCFSILLRILSRS